LICPFKKNMETPFRSKQYVTSTNAITRLEEVRMKRVLIITGPGGDAQGWGNLEVTKTISDALNSDGKSSEFAFVNTMDDFLKAIDHMPGK